MNYIELINSFWQTRRTQRLSSNEADLYYFLMQECNIRGWENPFECPNGLICATIGMAEKTLIDVRNRLQQRGLIEFEAGQRKARSPIYLLLYCKKVSINDSIKVSKTVSKKVSKKVSKTVNLNTKTETKTKTEEKEEKEFPTAQRFFIEVSELNAFLKSEQSWCEVVCMNNRINPSELLEKIDEFSKLMIERGEQGKTPQDAKSHFVNWLKKQKGGNNAHQQGTGKGNSTNSKSYGEK